MQLYHWNNKIGQEAFSNVAVLADAVTNTSLFRCLLASVILGFDLPWGPLIFVKSDFIKGLRLHIGFKKFARKSLVWRRLTIEVVPE